MNKLPQKLPQDMTDSELFDELENELENYDATNPRQDDYAYRLLEEIRIRFFHKDHKINVPDCDICWLHAPFTEEEKEVLKKGNK